jgi:hypothetical protein
MPTLGLNLWQRLAGRLVFYGLVLSGLWAVGRSVPDPAAAEAAKWEAAGVAKPYIAIPYEAIERELFRLSR